MKKSHDEGRESNTKQNTPVRSDKQSAQRPEVIKVKFNLGMTKWFTTYSGITKW